MAVTASDLARELGELIAALDRRAPRVERAGESAIARDASALREKAVQGLSNSTRTSGLPLAGRAIVQVDCRIPEWTRKRQLESITSRLGWLEAFRAAA